MKANTPLRIFDLAGQLIMLFPLVVTQGTVFERIVYTYFSLGSWQVLSHIIHVLANPEARTRRRGYSRFLLLAGIPAAIGGLIVLLGYGSGADTGLAYNVYMLGVGILFVECLILLFAAPLLAIWYVKLCFDELSSLRAAAMHRREIHWKL